MPKKSPATAKGATQARPAATTKPTQKVSGQAGGTGEGNAASNPPTVDDVMGLYRQRETDGDEARLRSQARLFRTLVRMDHDVKVPRQYRAISRKIRTPFIRDAWHRISAALTQNPPSEHVEPISEAKDAKQAANVAERWTQAVREQMTKELGEDVIYEAVRALVRDGESVVKVVHRDNAWANFPDRERGEDGEYTEEADAFTERTNAFKRQHPLPFAWRVVDRLSILRGDGEYGDDWIIEYGEYPKADLKRRYRMAEHDGRLVDPTILGGMPRPEGSLEASSSGMVVKVEYWDADWWAVVVDGVMAPGFPKPNLYAPKMPYFVARADSDSDSVLYSLKELVPALDGLLSMKFVWGHLGAFPNPVLKPLPAGQQAFDLDPTGDSGETPTFRWEAGKMLIPPKGYEFGFLEPPPVGADLNELVSILRGMIDVAGVPAEMRGGGVGATSGYEYNQRAAMMIAMYLRLARATQRQFEQAISFIWWMVRYVIKDSVFVLAAGAEKDAPRTWLGLKDTGTVTDTVAPVDKLGPLTLKLRPKMTTDLQAAAMIALQMVNSPKQLISKRYALEEFVGVENPDDMAEEIAVENALDEEPLKSMVVEEALRDAGMLPPTPPPQPPMDPAAGMIPPGPNQLNPFPPGQVAGGLPAVPGLTMPLTPTPPQGVPPGMTPGAPGQYPGQPGNQGPSFPSPVG